MDFTESSGRASNTTMHRRKRETDLVAAVREVNGRRLERRQRIRKALARIGRALADWRSSECVGAQSTRHPRLSHGGYFGPLGRRFGADYYATRMDRDPR